MGSWCSIAPGFAGPFDTLSRSEENCARGVWYPGSDQTSRIRRRHIRFSALVGVSLHAGVCPLHGVWYPVAAVSLSDSGMSNANSDVIASQSRVSVTGSGVLAPEPRNGRSFTGVSPHQ